VVDRERILARLDDLDTFLRELRSIAPKSLDEYLKTEKRARASGSSRSRSRR